MIKKEIIEKISKYFKLTNFEAEKIYDDIFAGIIQGVKEDNIADITNLGEFIIKYNNADSKNKKTVEFLPTLSLEDEINQRSYDENRQFETEKSEKPVEENTAASDKMHVQGIPMTKENNSEEENNQINKNRSEHEMEDEKHSVEDDIKKKREEILNKITTPKVERINTPVPPVIIPPIENPVDRIEKKEEFIEAKEKTENIPDEITENITEKINEPVTDTKKEVNELNEKSFSDYFAEVSGEEKSVSNQMNKTPIPPPVNEVKNVPPVETVIPPGAVELHNELTGDKNKVNEYQTTINPLPYANGNGNGNGNGNNFEHHLQDNSYYIWYKDSEPNSTDTQTMSYEYELLYQATKEAEYKSKLRIYVTTFIMFFSIVLILLIFSPVIYKYFFTPGDVQNTEEVQQETSSNNEEPINSQNNQASVNSLDKQAPVNNNTPPTTEQNTSTEQPKQETNVQQQPVQQQPKQEQPKKEEPVKEQPKQQSTNQTIPGVTKNSMGWMDDNNKVIYVQLENGKYTIQESAWDSDAKANKRISAVGSMVPGLKGNILKVDLGSKGAWYRVRFGEFSTIEQAKQKAEELRSKERNRLQALLLTFLLYA